jgi:hypothetical protein
LRFSQVDREVGGRRFEVGLVSVVYDRFAIRVEFAHEFERRARDASLPVLGFGIDDDLDVAGFALCGDFVEGGEHLFGR